MLGSWKKAGTSFQVATRSQVPVNCFPVQLLISLLTSDKTVLEVASVCTSYSISPTPTLISISVKNGATRGRENSLNENGENPVNSSKVKYPLVPTCKENISFNQLLQ